VDFEVAHHDRALALRARSQVRSGPFICRFSPHLPDAFANFAIMVDNAAPTAADVRALTEAFRERGRTPRVEFLAGCVPDAARVLAEAGFTVRHRGVVMACAPSWLTAPAPVPGLDLAEPRCPADLETFALVQHRAFAEPGEAGPGAAAPAEAAPGEAGRGAAARLARMRERGGLVMLARYRGQIAGGAACTAPVNGVGELDGVAVAECARRRGIGAAVSARLTALAYRRGYHLVWLESSDPAARRVYARIGYRPIADRLYMTLGQ
jgi:GNAT superfamily N-acetyltransferase